MSAERISINIGSDVKKIGKLLRSSIEDRVALMLLIKDPIKAFKENGINIDAYATKRFPKDKIVKDIKHVLTTMLDKHFKDRFKNIIATTLVESETSKETQYNWDHSTHNDYQYEQNTDTQRGATTETDKKTSVGTEQSFDGLTTKEFGDMLIGPLLSEKVIQVITLEIEKTLTYASTIET
jgi:hypothetical protein